MKEIVLRDYQEECLSKLIWARGQEGNDLCVLPQGAGKSIIIAAYAHKIGKSVLILQPNREILKQNYDKLCQIVSPVEVGVYSASMKRKDTGFYTFATIQSIYKKPEEFKSVDTMIIDECDLVNPRKLGMYTQFWKDIGKPKIVGFTATPYRLATRYKRWGKLSWQVTATTVTEMINRVYPPFWKRLVYKIDMDDLIKEGYLLPLQYEDSTLVHHPDIPLNKSRSEFDLKKHWKMVEDKKIQVVRKILHLKAHYKSILVFTGSIEEAEYLKGQFTGSRIVTHKTPRKERELVIQRFKDQEVQIVFNVQTLTAGFDYPGIDCIVLTRPTRSLRLYQQILGRGTRPPTPCKVVDFSGTVESIGPIESIRVDKNEGRWDVYSETEKGLRWWHNKDLYSYKLKEPKS